MVLGIIAPTLLVAATWMNIKYRTWCRTHQRLTEMFFAELKPQQLRKLATNVSPSN